MIRKVTQLELENFALGVSSAEEAEGANVLSVADVRAQEAVFFRALVQSGKVKEDDEVPTWAEDYERMLSAGLRPRLAAYVAWATMPKKYRVPETQAEFATQVLGLTSDRVISTWRKKFPEIDVMISELQAEKMLEYRPGAFRALGEVASDPSYRANPDRRLFFEMTKDYTPRTKVETTEGAGVGRKLLDKFKGMSTAQLIEALGEDGLELVKELEEDINAQESGDVYVPDEQDKIIDEEKDGER